MESLPAIGPLESGRAPQPGEVINMTLIQELLDHHREDYKGMFEEEKAPFLQHLQESLETETNLEVKRAAELFLKEVKGGNYEN